VPPVALAIRHRGRKFLTCRCPVGHAWPAALATGKTVAFGRACSFLTTFLDTHRSRSRVKGLLFDECCGRWGLFRRAKRSRRMPT